MFVRLDLCYASQSCLFFALSPSLRFFISSFPRLDILHPPALLSICGIPSVLWLAAAALSFSVFHFACFACSSSFTQVTHPTSIFISLSRIYQAQVSLLNTTQSHTYTLPYLTLSSLPSNSQYPASNGGSLLFQLSPLLVVLVTVMLFLSISLLIELSQPYIS